MGRASRRGYSKSNILRKLSWNTKQIVNLNVYSSILSFHWGGIQFPGKFVKLRRKKINQLERFLLFAFFLLHVRIPRRRSSDEEEGREKPDRIWGIKAKRVSHQLSSEANCWRQLCSPWKWILRQKVTLKLPKGLKLRSKLLSLLLPSLPIISVGRTTRKKFQCFRSIYSRSDSINFNLFCACWLQNCRSKRYSRVAEVHRTGRKSFHRNAAASTFPPLPHLDGWFYFLWMSTKKKWSQHLAEKANGMRGCYMRQSDSRALSSLSVLSFLRYAINSQFICKWNEEERSWNWRFQCEPRELCFRHCKLLLSVYSCLLSALCLLRKRSQRDKITNIQCRRRASMNRNSFTRIGIESPFSFVVNATFFLLCHQTQSLHWLAYTNPKPHVSR